MSSGVTGGGAGGGSPGGRLDVALVFRRAGQVLARDFAPVVLAGFILVLFPAVGAQVLSIPGEWGTLFAILRGVLAMLFVAAVSWGVVARLRGRDLPPHVFVREGLVRAQPGLQVALLAGAAVVGGLTLHLFAQHGTLAGWLLDVLLLAAGLLGVCVLMPLVPAAVVERLGPMAAIRRAASLTDGNRNRILALALLLAAALALPGVVVANLVRAGDGGIWLVPLFEFIAWSLVATLPAVVYAGLEEAA